MEKFEIKYRMSGKAAPPRPIRIQSPGWGGDDVKMENGSEPQPWHCLPFVEASTYGLELVYPYETECQVVNENGKIRFDWDYTKEPGAKLLGGEFVTFFPEPSKFYLFNTNLDLQSPPGHVIRTEPHPRFFTDDTGTVPMSIAGHVQTEWWPKLFFVVFRVPAPGQRHIFRKDEAFAQILFVPRRMDYEPVEMTSEEAARRDEMEQAIIAARSHVATNIWHNPAGYEFNNHYKLLARAFARDGATGVDELIKKGLERNRQGLPPGKTVAEYLEMGRQLLDQKKWVEARRVFMHVLDLDSANAQAISGLSTVAVGLELPELALRMAREAAALEPRSAAYQAQLGQLLFDRGSFEEAYAAFRAALNARPNDAEVLSRLALTLSHLGRVPEAVQVCRAALRQAPQSAMIAFRMAQILADNGQAEGARVYFDAALKLDPTLQATHRALQQNSQSTPEVQ